MWERTNAVKRAAAEAATKIRAKAGAEKGERERGQRLRQGIMLRTI